MAKEDHSKDGETGKSEDDGKSTFDKKEEKAAAAPSGGPHAGMKMKMPMSAALRATTTQKVAWALLSVIGLAAGLVISASTTNLRLSARDVGGAVMPPGMIMLRDTPGKAMRDMAAVDPRAVTYTAPPDARGDQTLTPRLENGVKVFDLELSVIYGTSCLTNK